jgi:hypothetical protein
LSPRRVRFTATARRHITLERTWWLENRIHTGLFTDELEEAVRILMWLPGAGTLYLQAGVDGLRRLYVPRVACHIYYTFDTHEVIVRAFWGARRRRGPRISP